MSDRAGEGHTDKEWIKEANKRLEKKGATSRYVDAKPEDGFQFEQSGVLTVDQGDAPPEVPENLRRRGNEMEDETNRMIAESGRPSVRGRIDLDGVGSNAEMNRVANVINMLSKMRALGWGYSKYEEELADHIEEHYPASRGVCPNGHRLTWDGDRNPVHVHKDEAEVCDEA